MKLLEKNKVTYTAVDDEEKERDVDTAIAILQDLEEEGMLKSVALTYTINDEHNTVTTFTYNDSEAFLMLGAIRTLESDWVKNYID